jgi:ATPase subunit of ABC transporter with duplicated ATPase domains
MQYQHIHHFLAVIMIDNHHHHQQQSYHHLHFYHQHHNNNHVGILLVVSHDQVFLDSICTDIVELKSQLAGQSKSCLTHYSGDYSSYTNTVEEHRVAQHRLRVAFEKERDKLKEFIARDGKKYDNPAHQSQRKVS